MSQIMFPGRDSPVPQGGFGIFRVDSPDAIESEIVDDKWFQTLRYGKGSQFL